MYDKILFKKIKICIGLPNFMKKKKTTLSSKFATIQLYWKNGVMIIHSIYILAKFRGNLLFSNLLNELEKLKINIKIQSVINIKLFKYLLRNGWKKVKNELSVYKSKL